MKVIDKPQRQVERAAREHVELILHLMDQELIYRLKEARRVYYLQQARKVSTTPIER